MPDRAFGDQREWERRLSGSWASQLPLELCGQRYTLSLSLSLFFFISLPLSWSSSLNNSDSTHFYGPSLPAVKRSDEASAHQKCSKTKRKSHLSESDTAHWEEVWIYLCWHVNKCLWCKKTKRFTKEGWIYSLFIILEINHFNQKFQAQCSNVL